jgi:hypothetical protein
MSNIFNITFDIERESAWLTNLTIGGKTVRHYGLSIPNHLKYSNSNKKRSWVLCI